MKDSSEMRDAAIAYLESRPDGARYSELAAAVGVRAYDKSLSAAVREAIADGSIVKSGSAPVARYRAGGAA